MTTRWWVLVVAAAAIALTVAQDALPGRAEYHSWQYVTLLALGIVVAGSYVWRAWRGDDGELGRRVAAATAGALVTACAGLVCSLIGPDAVTVTGAPGAVTPVADIVAAAAFPPTDPGSIERGDATVALRRRGVPPIEIGSRPVPLGLSVAYAQPHLAAFVEVADGAGRRLTVTQPANASFLSPVLFFRETQTLRGRSVPFDTFAVPGANRVVHALAFSAADLAAFGRSVPEGGGAVILSVEDEQGNARGIGMALSGRPVEIAGLRFTITTGTYPVLIVAAAPEPFAMLGGMVLFALGCAWALLYRAPRVIPSVPREAGAVDSPR